MVEMSADEKPNRRVVVSALGIGQVLSWGSTFYLLAVLAPAIVRDTGWKYDWVISGVSVGLLIAGNGAELRLVSRGVAWFSDHDRDGGVALRRSHRISVGWGGLDPRDVRGARAYQRAAGRAALAPKPARPASLSLSPCGAWPSDLE